MSLPIIRSLEVMDVLAFSGHRKTSWTGSKFKEALHCAESNLIGLGESEEQDNDSLTYTYSYTLLK